MRITAETFGTSLSNGTVRIALVAQRESGEYVIVSGTRGAYREIAPSLARDILAGKRLVQTPRASVGMTADRTGGIVASPKLRPSSKSWRTFKAFLTSPDVRIRDGRMSLAEGREIFNGLVAYYQKG